MKKSRHNPTKLKGRTALTDARRRGPTVTGLQKQLDQRTCELVEARKHLAEALDQQTATSEVLHVISRSPGDLKPVFQAMLENATRICDAKFGVLQLYEDGGFRIGAIHNAPPAFAEAMARREPLMRPTPRHPFRRMVTTKAVVQIADLMESRAYKERDYGIVMLVERASARTFLAVPMLKKNEVVGVIAIYRQEVRAFTDKQVAVVVNFANQAVIAIENIRLLNELRERTDDLTESLEQQTATGEVLKVISSSPGELRPVFDAMLENATRICRCEFGRMALHDGSAFRTAAVFGATPEYTRFLKENPEGHGGLIGQMTAERKVVHLVDVREGPGYRSGNPFTVSAIELGGARSAIAVPLLKEGSLIGALVLYRKRVAAFTESQIALVQAFAEQAVIAIENARLLGELRDRSAELARSVDELTATSNVLKTISRSTVGLQTVLDTLVETAARLCRADQAHMFRRHPDDLHHLIAVWGAPQEGIAYIRAHPFAPDRGTTSGRVALERRPIHIPDVLADPEYTYREGQRAGGFRTMLGVPLLREDTILGVFVLGRNRVDPFTDKEIELVTTFADQAVIAIENARLFEELHERQAELRVTFDSMGDGVAMFDAEMRLTAWNRNFQQILDLPDGVLAQRPSWAEYLRLLAERGEFGTEDIEAELSRRLAMTDPEIRLERTRPDGRTIEVRRNVVPGGGFVLIYSDITERKRAEEQIRAARDTAETALEELKAAQRSLVHAEKMASLGQLTAGIAHEIKNPLNFVNNFAALSVDLLDEFQEEAKPVLAALDTSKRTGIDETIKLLSGNLQKITEHGRRADGIVKSMLLHSRGGSGERQRVDLNALIEEALNLAYHGARAQDQTFNITLEREFDPSLAPVEVVPQDMTRVFLNLFGNGFYAAAKRSRDSGSSPVLKVSTRDLGDSVEIRICDNGVGIPPENRDKLFQPFFTTKPTGEGTGLGLSISYEIVTQEHGGTIDVASEVNAYTEFTIRLPRNRRTKTEGRAA